LYITIYRRNVHFNIKYISSWKYFPHIFIFIRWAFSTLKMCHAIKGVFAKNVRGYKLTAKNNRFWSLLILLLSVASIRRELLKTTYTEERSVHTNSESLQYTTRIVKNSTKSQTNHSDIRTYSHRLFFDAFLYSWYFIIFFIRFVSNALKMPKKLAAKCLCS